MVSPPLPLVTTYTPSSHPNMGGTTNQPSMKRLSVDSSFFFIGGVVFLYCLSLLLTIMPSARKQTRRRRKRKNRDANSISENTQLAVAAAALATGTAALAYNRKKVAAFIRSLQRNTSDTKLTRKHPGSTPTARSPNKTRTIKNPSSAEVKTWTTWAHDPKQKRNPVACIIRNKKTSSAMLVALMIALQQCRIAHAFQHPINFGRDSDATQTCDTVSCKNTPVLHCIWPSYGIKNQDYACELCQTCVTRMQVYGFFEPKKKPYRSVRCDKNGNMYKYYYTLSFRPYIDTLPPPFPWEESD